MAPSGKNINSTQWHELTIEPKANSPGKTFTVRMICRNSKLEKVTEIADKNDDTVIAIIENVLLKRG